MSLALATEDRLSEAIGLKLVQTYAGQHTNNLLLLRRDGFGYLRSGMDKWIQLAKQRPVLLLTDLDRVACPSQLKTEWLNRRKLPSNLLFRIVVRAIESWLMADPIAMNTLFGKQVGLPPICDEVEDPKQYLLDLARRAKRDVREDLIIMKGTVASQGIAYNDRLCELVRQHWNAERAADRSPSLARAISRIQQLA